jgi:glycerol-3-phosphate cytidylyltransferase
MKTGLICGCFDLFHVGHLNILEKCKQNCDYLIVGIACDEYIRMKKQHEPAMNEHDRQRIISALKCVDEVHIFNIDEIQNKLNYCDAHHIDIIFDGDDYINDERYKKIKDAGRTEVMFFPYTKGISSTQLKKCLK